MRILFLCYTTKHARAAFWGWQSKGYCYDPIFLPAWKFLKFKISSLQPFSKFQAVVLYSPVLMLYVFEIHWYKFLYGNCK